MPSGNSFVNPTQRVGVILGEILEHARPVQVLGMVGMHKRCPKNKGETIKFRRYLPTGGSSTNQNTINRWNVDPNTYMLQEGVTPDADQLVAQDISVTLNQYGVLYSHTDKMDDLHEDDMPSEHRKRVGELMGLVAEMVRYGAIKACTNKFYGGTGTGRTTVNGPITLNVLRRIARNLYLNHAGLLTSVLAPSVNFNTAPVEGGYIVFCSTDGMADIRDLPGYKHVVEYGTRKPLSPREAGACEDFRFITSPELTAYADAASSVTASTASPPLYSTTGTNPDVYPFIVTGEDAWGQVAMKFNGDEPSIDPTWLPCGQKDKTDPLGQRGYAGGKFWTNTVLLNQGWMAVAECGVSALS